MKQFLFTTIIALSCATVLTAGMDKVVAKIPKVSISHAQNPATTEKITGYINRIDYSFGNSTSTVSIVSVIASNSLTGLATSLPFPSSPVATNVSYQLTNYVQRLSLYDEAITIIATNAAYTNQSAAITIFYERP